MDMWDYDLLPYLSIPRNYNGIIAGTVASNLIFAWLTNKGLNTVAVGAEITKRVVNDFNLPIIGSTHDALDWIIRHTRQTRLLEIPEHL